MLKKLAYRKEPKLHVHKYIVAVSRRLKKQNCTNTKWHYCSTLKEVMQVCKRQKKGSWIDVFSASHNFIQAYAVE